MWAIEEQKRNRRLIYIFFLFFFSTAGRQDNEQSASFGGIAASLRTVLRNRELSACSAFL
jgi:hypothetical protein